VTVRKWANRFGGHFVNCIKRDRPAASDKWHLDEVVVLINGAKFRLWQAIDANGDVLDNLVQKQRNAKAARRFLMRLIGRFGTSRAPTATPDPMHSIAAIIAIGSAPTCPAVSPIGSSLI
jgi:transposase-like protein